MRVTLVLLLVTVFARPSAAQVSFDPTPASFPFPSPGFLVTGDFNEDGKLDVVGPIGQQGRLMLGAGNGTLGSPTHIPFIGNNPYQVETGDFNGDGNLDLVVSDNQSGFVRVLPGDGAGHFGAPIASANRTSRYVAVADFNADGKQDVVTLDTNAFFASVLLGNGDGTFQPRTDYINPGPNPNPVYPAPLTYGPTSVATGDLDGDGDADIVFGNQGGGVAILVNNGNGTFNNPPTNITASNVLFGGIGWVRLADLNHDNRLDLLTWTSTKPSHVFVLQGNGNATFSAPTPIPVIAAAFNPTDNIIACHQEIGGATCGKFFTLADLDQDSHIDLVVPHEWDGGRFSFVRGNGDGTFAAPTTYSLPNYTWEPGYTVMGDLNNDGKPDLVTTRWRQHELTVLTNTTVVSQPPTITVPANMTVEGNTLGGATVTFTVTAARSSGQPLTPSCVPSSGAFFALGTSTVNCEASDAVGTASASFTVTVVDTIAPVLTVPANQTLEATSAAGAIATFVASATDVVSPVAISFSQDPGTFFALGTTTVTVTATDAPGNSTTGMFTITVGDTTAPAIASVTPSQGTLWPPNHQMVAITVSAVVTDAVGVTSLKIINVTSSEPDNGLGDGDTAGDIVITGPLSVNLRAERSGKGNGRTYTITVEARDASGNVSTKTCTVVVPKSQGGK